MVSQYQITVQCFAQASVHVVSVVCVKEQQAEVVYASEREHVLSHPANIKGARRHFTLFNLTHDIALRLLEKVGDGHSEEAGLCRGRLIVLV